MDYSVILTDTARADVEAIFAATFQQAPDFLKALGSLSRFPNRCAMAREAQTVGRRIRCLLFEDGPDIYRSLYEVDEPSQRVWILHVSYSLRNEG